MANFAYLRISTNKQDIDNQKLSILDYCNKHSLIPVKYIKDISSGKLHWKKRPIGNVFEKANDNDHIIVAEVSRLGRSTIQVLEILMKINSHLTQYLKNIKRNQALSVDLNL